MKRKDNGDPVPVGDRNRLLVDWKDGRGFSPEDACCGALVTGSVGAGKTSGPGRLLVQSYLRSYGLVLRAKPQPRKSRRKGKG